MALLQVKTLSKSTFENKNGRKPIYFLNYFKTFLLFSHVILFLEVITNSLLTVAKKISLRFNKRTKITMFNANILK